MKISIIRSFSFTAFIILSALELESLMVQITTIAAMKAITPEVSKAQDAVNKVLSIRAIRFRMALMPIEDKSPFGRR